MGILTSKQVLEKQVKDLRIRLENREGKAELAMATMESDLIAAKTQLKEKDTIISILQREIAALTKELEAAKNLSAEAVQELIDKKVASAVAEATASLTDELTKAHAEIARLKAIINKDSTNSSKPPGQNGFKRHQNNSREKSGRLRGGQPGHPGHRLGLPENLDELVAQGVVQMQVVDHTNGDSEYVSRYVIDIEVMTTITEHRFTVGMQLPKGMYNEVSYGDLTKATTVLLLNEGIIAEKRLSDMFAGLTLGAVTISPATLERFQSQFADKLESSGELEAIKEDLLIGEVMCTDDTPMRCAETIEFNEDGKMITRTEEGKSFTATVRTHSNDRSTFYTVNPKKDKEGVERDGVLPRYFGTLCQDDEAKFYNYGKENGTCGGHLCRDLKGLRDLQLIQWAGDMRTYMQDMNRHKNRDLLANKTECDPELLEDFERGYVNLVERGRAELGLMKKGDFGFDEFNAMVNRLTKRRDNYLLFMRDYEVPFTNNLAERDLRVEKTKQKVSLLFRTWEGITNHAKTRSFLSTVKKRKGNLFDSIVRVLNGEEVLQGQ